MYSIFLTLQFFTMLNITMLNSKDGVGYTVKAKIH